MHSQQRSCGHGYAVRKPFTAYLPRLQNQRPACQARACAEVRENSAAAATAAALLVLTSSTAVPWDSALAAAASPPSVTGSARVVDGDTLVIDGNKFRLYAVDAPESKQTCSDAQGRSYACGLAAKDALAKKIGSLPVTCQVRTQDQYGRGVAVCSLASVAPKGGVLALTGGAPTEDLNAWMVSNGWAVAYREYGKDYVAAEEAAKAAGRGVWAGSFEYPAKWRKEEKAGVPHPPLGPPRAGPAAAAAAAVGPTALAALGTQLPPAVVPAAAPTAAAQGPGAGGPPGCAIKGNIGSSGNKIYHMPGGPYYESVLVEPEKGERFFCSEQEAVAAGFRPINTKQ